MPAPSAEPVRPADGASGASLPGRLLAWYDRHHRDLPWRTSPSAAASGVRADPYHVWLSEIMLQQTTVEAVKPYFRAFLARWPTLEALAAAPETEVLNAWAGLGYYSRARNLKRCAEAVTALHDGRLPEDEAALRALPGIGDYTAAAVAAIAFGHPAAVVDGNVERVTARLFAIDRPVAAAKREIRERIAALVPAARPGDFAQAMMDLGATICTPRRPSCMLCPLRDDCLAFRGGDPERYPPRAAKAERPMRRGAAYVAVRDGAVLLRRRGERGLLAGMTEVPNSSWSARSDGDVTTATAPFPGPWRAAGTVTHVFTHFTLELTVYRLDVAGTPASPAGHWWAPLSGLPGEGLPTVMKKAVEAALPGATRPKRESR